MKSIITAYGMVVANLNHHVNPNSTFQHADELLPLVSSGPPVYGLQALNESLSVGAKNLIRELEESQRPLFVSIWGGANTLAQALQHIEETKPKDQAAILRSQLRVYSISDQDDAGPWIRAMWPEIFYIVNIHGFQEFAAATWPGISSADNGAANTTKVVDAWLTPNIRVGPLGAVYPLIEYGMEGDTPSFLWLIQNGLSNAERPDWGGWGGRYTRTSDWAKINLYSYSIDRAIDDSGNPYQSAYATIWRWRDAYQDDFASRMQWTLTPDFKKATHPPSIILNGSPGTGPLYLTIPYNSSVILDASETIDTDHPGNNSELDFSWFTYLEAGFPRGVGSIASFIEIQALDTPLATNGAPGKSESGFGDVVTGAKVKITNLVPKSDVFKGIEWHVILQVKTKKGPYAIRRYKRLIIQSPEE